MPDASPAGAALIIGVGNAMRGDDGVGPWVAATCRAAGCAAQVHGGDGTGLIDLFAAAPELILVDATRSGRPCGALSVFDARTTPLPAAFFHYSTHRFGLAEAVETARALGLLPAKALTVYGIEGADFSAGRDLSPEVARSATALAAQLIGKPPHTNAAANDQDQGGASGGR